MEHGGLVTDKQTPRRIRRDGMNKRFETIEALMADLNTPDEVELVGVIKALLEHAVYDRQRSDQCIAAVENAERAIELWEEGFGE
jgi:hypothetical protein